MHRKICRIYFLWPTLSSPRSSTVFPTAQGTQCSLSMTCLSSIRNICFLIQLETQAKFPQSKFQLLGGFFFLRFICPAIVSPDTINIIDKPLDGPTRRALILISKILQNIANGTQFNEEYMKPLNSFVKENTERTKKLFDQLVKQSSYFPNTHTHTHTKSKTCVCGCVGCVWKIRRVHLS